MIVLLKILGFLSFFVSIIATIFGTEALIERLRWGRGIMFADVEILFMLALLFLLVGFIFVFVANKLKKRLNKK
jgi:hypothetical protein